MIVTSALYSMGWNKDITDWQEGVVIDFGRSNGYNVEVIESAGLSYTAVKRSFRLWKKTHNADRISGRTSNERKYSLIEIAKYCHDVLTIRFATKQQLLENTNSGPHIPISQQTLKRLPYNMELECRVNRKCLFTQKYVSWAKLHKKWAAEE